MEQAWTSISAVQSQLAERFYEHVAPDWLVGYKAAWDSLISQLADGVVASRVSSSGEFRAELLEPGGRSAELLGFREHRTISPVFWRQCRVVEEHIAGDRYGLPALQREDGYFYDRRDDAFEFVDPSFLEGVSLHGKAGPVQVDAAALSRPNALVRKPRGRPLGSVQHGDDLQFVERTIALIQTQGTSRASAIAKVASLVPQKNRALPSVKTWLRREVAKRGY